MSTSPHEGRILYDTATLAASAAMCTAQVRDGPINNLLHYADQAAQVRINWSAPLASISDAQYPYLEPGVQAMTAATTSISQYDAFALRAAFSPKVHSTGDGYHLRVRIAGRSSAGDRVDFKVVCAPYGRASAAGATLPSPIASMDFTDITSTTVSELTPDSGENVLEIPKEVIDAAIADFSSWSTLTDIGGGPISLRLPIVEVYAVAQTHVVLSTPELHMLHVSEYVGL